MKLTYYALLYADVQGGYSVIIPDVGGATQGETIEECSQMAADVIHCVLDEELQAGKQPPERTEYPEILQKADPEFGPVSMVMPVTVYWTTGTRRLSISLADSTLEIIDNYLAQSGGTRSGLLAQSTLDYIARQQHASLSATHSPTTQTAPKRRRTPKPVSSNAG